MTVLAETDREFWREVLLAGGRTTVPRWTLEPVPGVAQCRTPVPAHELAAVDRLATELDVPPSAVLLAAHARVLAALAGEDDVVTGLSTGGAPLPCRIATAAGSWRGLLRECAQAESAVRAHAEFPVGDLRRELGVPAQFETVVDLGGLGGDLPDDAVLRLEFRRDDDGPVLALTYRTDAIDSACADRIAGYHLTALAQLVADPDADPRQQWLLSADELAFQFDWLAGPRRELPDVRAHQLFEQQVRAHPDAVAAVHRGREWTYGELNARANRIGRALAARGLGAEAVVAVVTERNLDWLACVLGIWKAGCAYLPLEPQFPAGRLAAALGRSECRLVLTDGGASAGLDEALAGLPGVERLTVGAADGEGHPDGDLEVPVAPDQLAYIYFTSGSTGEPKGAMCEHAGMLNHLLAKIDDLGIAEGQVVAQTAPQCFDISLWQLVSALLVGGRTLLVEQEVVLDVERFVDTVTEGRVAVLQVVPSYLEVVLSYLEQHPRPLPDLRIVSVTGEAVKKGLVQRWFATAPDIPLVNAYGLTETSDDTNHAVLTRPPDGDRVPVGRPIANVHVDVLDEYDHPVPLGATGLIVFSGICVGRGYVNDPERTAALFGPDPNRSGQRICRSGDYGRWLPDGTLDVLGRRDNQVKIRGFRIEIGEIENALLRVPGVRDGCVVVAERPDRSRHLVAFCCGPEPVDVDALRGRLAQTLPEYMLPAVVAWRATLPLTGNGKIDRKALTAQAADLEPTETRSAAPCTDAERRVAAAWAAILGIPEERIGRQDSFFDLGGTSLSGVKLAVALDRAVSLKDVVRTPVLADLAELLAGRT
ncbi:non-ribosomal peptide synthetase [Geodermatophilus sp. URMC 64]